MKIFQIFDDNDKYWPPRYLGTKKIYQLLLSWYYDNINILPNSTSYHLWPLHNGLQIHAVYIRLITGLMKLHSDQKQAGNQFTSYTERRWPAHWVNTSLQPHSQQRRGATSMRGHNRGGGQHQWGGTTEERGNTNERHNRGGGHTVHVPYNIRPLLVTITIPWNVGRWIS